MIVSKIISVVLISLTLFILSCTNSYYCSKIIKHSKSTFGKDFTKGEIELSKVFSFNWDTLYVFGAYDHPSEISNAIGFDCKCDIVPDGKDLFLFVYKNEIIKKEVVECMNMTFDGKSNRTSVFKISNDSSKFTIRNNDEYYTLINRNN